MRKLPLKGHSDEYQAQGARLHMHIYEMRGRFTKYLSLISSDIKMSEAIFSSFC